jgi:hypothetical protein
MARAWGQAYGALFGLVIFGFPVVSSIPIVVGVDHRGISIVYRALVATFSFALLARGVYRRRPRISGVAGGAFAALVLILLARMFWDSVLTRLPLDLEWGDLWLVTIGVGLMPASVFCFLPHKEMLDSCHRSALVTGVCAVIAIVVGVAVSVQDLSKLTRLATDVLNPISVGLVGTSIAIVCLARFAAGVGVARSRAEAAATLAIGIAGVLLTLASASKGPILELTVTLTLIFVLRGKWHNTAGQIMRRVVFAVIALAALGAATFALSEFTSFGAVTRLSAMVSDPSTAIRQQIMRDALVEFDESPVFGSATVEYIEHTYPHNIVIESLMVGGIAGLTALLVFLICAVDASVRIYWQLPQCRWLALLFVQYLINSMLSGSLYSETLFWVTSLIVIATGSRLVESTRVCLNPGSTI